MRLIIYCFSLSILVGCSGDNSKSDSKSGKKKNGVVKSYYPDGAIKSEITFKDGKQHGKAKQYYNDGTLAREIDYANNIIHGWAKRYWETGKLYQETPYDSGKIHGVQKRYNGAGKLTAVATYSQGFDCMGLKEYLVDGSLKTEYPKIVLKTEDRLLSEASYYIRVSMSEKVKKVEYYMGNLTAGCMHDRLDPLMPDGKAKARIQFSILPGEIIMENINIIAKVETLAGNTYITQKPFNVAIEFPSPR
jgi:hypothetical protein